VSHQNVETVRRVLLASSHGDPVARRTDLDPQGVWDMSGVVGWTEKQVYRGEAEIVPFLQGWAASWRDWHFDVEEVRDATDDEVFAAIHEWGIGVGSGASVDQHRYFVVALRGGQIVSVRMFSDREPALKAVGLQE
jgi:ketosteroid isomerase-like protein